MKNEAITSDPAVMSGKPVINGTRITVEQVLRELSNGLSLEQIVDEYPRLTADSVRAAVAYAADYMANEVTIAAE